MLKKIMHPILIVSIIIQLFVPVGMIAYGNKAEEDLQKYGKEFRIPVYVQSIYNGLVDFGMYKFICSHDRGSYVVLEEDEYGYVYLEESQSQKPKTHDYIYVTKENLNKLNEDFVVNSDVNAWRVREESAYLLIRAYNGNFEIIDLYMDGVPAEEWFENATSGMDEYGNFELR
jgi:hypothetical protein